MHVHVHVHVNVRSGGTVVELMWNCSGLPVGLRMHLA